MWRNITQELRKIKNSTARTTFMPVEYWFGEKFIFKTYALLPSSLITKLLQRRTVGCIGVFSSVETKKRKFSLNVFVNQSEKLSHNTNNTWSLLKFYPYFWIFWPFREVYGTCFLSRIFSRPNISTMPSKLTKG